MEYNLKNTPYAWTIPLWLAIAKMEVAGFKSYIYTSYNNPWNMRPSKIRENTQSGVVTTKTNGDFATYATLDKAAQDILLYMQARQYPTTEMELLPFINFMGKKGYYGEESALSYYRKVVAWLQR